MKKEKRVIVAIWGDENEVIPLDGDADAISPHTIIATKWNNALYKSGNKPYEWAAYLVQCIVDQGVVYIPTDWDVVGVRIWGEGL